MENHQNTDRISSLPKLIRNHILSFLPIKEALNTAFLSRQWRCIASSLTTFRLEGNSDCSSLGLARFLDRIFLFLLEVHGLPEIKKISLSFPYGIRPSRLDFYMHFAIKRNVQEIYLHWSRQSYPKFSSSAFLSVFTCKTLTVLTLIYIELKVPQIITLPILKTLTLNSITFSDDHLTENFFESCPMLEDLTIEDCSLIHINVLSISSPTLKRLKIIIESDISKGIKLCAPNLDKLDYRCNLLPNLTAETLASLIRVKFKINGHFSRGLGKKVSDQHAEQIWMKLQNVVTLFLYHKLYLEFLTRCPDLLTRISVSSLKHLGLIMSSTKNHVKVITLLLSNCQHLETLQIFVTQGQSTTKEITNLEQYQQSNQWSNGDILKQLINVVFYYFQGSESELDLVKFVLGNASVLEKLEIRYSANMRLNSEACVKNGENVTSFNRVSPDATLSFL